MEGKKRGQIWCISINKSSGEKKRKNILYIKQREKVGKAPVNASAKVNFNAIIGCKTRVQMRWKR